MTGRNEMIADHIQKGKKLMLRCEVVKAYEANCCVEVVFPDGRGGNFHLNDFLPYDLEPYTGWEDASSETGGEV